VRRFRSKAKDDSEVSLDGGDDAGAKERSTEIAAVRLLGRREHSTRELKRKLAGKGHAQDAVERIVDKLAEKDLVSDERFATNFVAYHGRRGHGPTRIRAELRQQGATDEVINSALAGSDHDWTEIAIAVRSRKFGDQLPATRAERAKQSRFLQYRGFSTDQIRAAMASMAGNTSVSVLSDSDFDDSN
jgi:regulatory protein